MDADENLRRRELSLSTVMRPQTMGGNRHRPFSRIFGKMSFDFMKRNDLLEI